MIKTPSPEEIIQTLNQMPNLKTLGQDGLPKLFYKKILEYLGHLFIETVHKCFESRYMLKELNNAFITLIPKHMGASSFNEFRPISLTNIIYKVI